MYQSRLHVTNGLISLAVDALSGEVLEFIRESTWDNVCKNHVRECFNPLDGVIHLADGDARFYPPRYAHIKADPALTPIITPRQGDGEGDMEIFYPALVTAKGSIALSARVTIRLSRGDCRTVWQLTLDNQTGCEVECVNFPALGGMWLGESWQDDVLVLPRFAGWQVQNPSKKLAMTPPRIQWKWQEYLYEYNLGELNGEKDDRGVCTVELPYSGPASMLWMDLYDQGENTGIYMTCRNENLRMKALRADAMGDDRPGVGLAIVHKPSLPSGSAWQSEKCIVALHEGDWHWAADEYRAWFHTLPRPDVGNHRPKWFEQSPGLVAHYDFQYQLGGVVHRYKDIPHLLEMAKDMGFDHLLLSGWNEDGFDFGFPHYRPNPNLGTEAELQDALQKVKDMGGHVAFYVNARLCNTGFEDQQQRIRDSTIMNRDGSLRIEKYGAADASFALLCINDTKWRNDLAGTVKYLTHTIGADSMYLDQLAMAQSCKCYHPGHAEHAGDPAAWNAGYDKLLCRMRAEYQEGGMALIFEGCNDAFGPGASGQLITTLGGPFIGRMPEMYRYTFPDQILVDMMNPRRHSAMRPEHVARHSTEWLYKAFVNGMYFWCYDLEWDNTWRRDPEQYARLQKTVALRRKWLENYGHGTFRDNVGILAAPGDAWVRRYALDEGVLIACACEQGLEGSVTVCWDGPAPTVIAHTYDGTDVPLPCLCEKGQVTFSLPKSELAVVVLR